MALEPDAASIRAFLDALFRHADPGTFLSLRAFDQAERNRPPVLIEGVKINGDLAPLAARAAAAAGKAANGRAPAVFAPPVATFDNPNKARVQDVANGVALSVELDECDTGRARARLEFLIGPATVVVASGGEWADPATGEVHPKLHLHWRLTEPTRSPDDHARLREARWLAAVLVGADRTAVPIPHPLRWPGSWNMKSRPRLAGIAGGDADAEIELGDALERLAEAVEAAGLSGLATAGPHVPGEPQAPLADVASALAFVPNADLHWSDWNRIGMAAWRATGGATEGLEAWEAWSAKSGKHDPKGCEERWNHYRASPPSKIGAGTIFFLARAAGWQGRGGRPDRAEPPPFAERAEAEAPPTPPKQEPSASPPAAAAEQAKPAVWRRSDDWDEAAIPARPWIARGYLLRGSVTVAAGMGSAGKSSLMVGWAVAAALGAELGRFAPEQPCRVLTYNVEDDDDEQRRRFSAALRGFGRLPRDLRGRVHRCGPRDVGTLIERDPQTGKTSLTEAWVELEKLAAQVKPDVVMLDPLVELHTAEENDNTALRQVIALLRAFAVRHGCAVVLIHHTRKGAAAGDMDAIRGAGSIVGAARVALTVSPMTEDEAAQLNVAPDLRRSFFRLDSAKSNYAPAGEAAWHELVEHELDNGDLVAAAVPWAPRHGQERRREGAAPEAMALVLAAAERGTAQGPYSPRLSPSQPRSIAALMIRHGIKRPVDQKAALQSMLSQGWEVQEFRDAHRIRRDGLRAPNRAPKANWLENKDASE